MDERIRDHVMRAKGRLLPRLIVGIGAPVLLALGGIYLYFYGNPFICPVFELFGIYCPGCGAGRAAYSLVHLNLFGAIASNLLFTVFVPVVAYYIFIFYMSYVFRRRLPVYSPGKRIIIVTAVAIALFTVLRNIPAWPFMFLAPH